MESRRVTRNDYRNFVRTDNGRDRDDRRPPFGVEEVELSGGGEVGPDPPTILTVGPVSLHSAGGSEVDVGNRSGVHSVIKYPAERGGNHLTGPTVYRVEDTKGSGRR